MKRTIKRAIACILTLCALLSFAVPMGFATEGTQATSVTYDLKGWYSEFNANTYIYAGGAVNANGQKIVDAYAGTGNWKPVVGTVDNTAKPDGETDVGYSIITDARLMSNAFRINVKATNQEYGYFAIQIKSPGSGKYMVTLNHLIGTYENNSGIDEGTVYIVPVPTEAYTKYNVGTAVYGQESILNLSYGTSYSSGDTESSISAKAVSKAPYTFEANKEYLVIFGGRETTASSKESSGAAYMYLNSLVMTPCVASVTTGGQTQHYTAENMAAAINAASAGDTVQITGNLKLTETINTKAAITVSTGATLDLNGNKLTANSVFSSGNIIDSSEDSAGVVTVAEADGAPMLDLAATNSQIPLYDADNGGYRFFTISVASKKTVDSENAAKFWFSLNCSEEAAELIAAGKSGLILSANLVWDNGSQNVTFGEDNSFIQKWATAVVNNPGKTVSMVLTVNGVDAVNSLSLTPAVSTSFDVGATGTALSWTAA